MIRECGWQRVSDNGDVMSSNFDWYSDDDRRWEPEPQAENPPPNRPWGWLILTLLTAVLLAWAFFIVYRQANERITAVQSVAQEDVLAVHQLTVQAVAAGDSDLFRAVLSGREQAWTDTQLEMVGNGRFWNRDLLDMTLLEPETAPVPDIVLAADLRSAEVSYSLPYQVGEEVVALQHTAVYRRGENRWLYSPPDDEFWGNTVINEGPQLTLIYPQRDAELLDKIAFDLDRIVQRVCFNSPGLNCFPAMRYTVRFSTQAESLLQGLELRSAVQSGRQISLPTPTLSGLPLDEMGYRALLRSYATRVVLAVTADLTAYDCCGGGLIFRALVDWQLAQAGVAAWPLTPDLYEELLRADVGRNSPNISWQSGDVSGRAGNWQAAYAFIHFLMTEQGQDPADIQRVVGSSLLGWLRDNELDFQENYDQWVAFIFANSTSGLMPPAALPVPQSNLNMFCRASFGVAQTLYRYDFMDQVWRTLITFSNRSDSINVSAVDLPDAFFITEYNYQASTSYTSSTLWWRGVQYPLFRPPAGDAAADIFSSLSLLGVDPQQRYLAVSVITSRPAAVDDIVEEAVKLVDLRTCTTSGCQSKELPGQPAWSPEGTWMLMLQNEEYSAQGFPKFPLYLADGDGENALQVGEGMFHFWLDEQHYAFLRWPDREIFLEDLQRMTEEILPWLEMGIVGEAGFQPLLTSAVLRAALPQELEELPEMIIPFRLQPNPNVKGDYLVWGFDPDGGGVLIFFLQQFGTPQQRLVYVDRGSWDYQPTFSPNGRYLQYASPANNSFSSNSRRESVLLNLETGEKQLYSQTMSSNNQDWSQEGGWLLQNQTNYTLLFAPDSGYHRLVMTNKGNCEPPFWSKN